MIRNAAALQALAYALTSLDHAEARIDRNGDQSCVRGSIDGARRHVGEAIHAMLPELRANVMARLAMQADGTEPDVEATAIGFAGWRWSTRAQGMVHDRLRDAAGRHVPATRDEAFTVTFAEPAGPFA